MVDTSSILNIVKGYLGSGTVWFVLALIVMICGVLIYAYMSRKSKLKYNCLELVRFGNGKIGINLMKAGSFKNKVFLGLFDYGTETITKVSDGRMIQQAKTSYLHDIFGKKGFIVFRSPKDPKILVPINKADFANMNLVFEIAPADYREASVRLFRSACEETKGTWEKLLPYLAVGFCIVLTIISIVINMQMTNNTVNKVGDMLIEGCTNKQNVQGGASP